MKKISIFFSVILVSSMLSCIQKPTETTNFSKHENLLFATLWMQHAAEVRALQYQAFNIAKEKLTYEISNYSSKKLPALVVDIDETILDNSTYESTSIIQNFAYPDRWDEWMDAANAREIPGAVRFLNFANDAGVTVFYITNRKEKYRVQTLKNLKNKNFPVDDSQLMMRTESSSKEVRRQKVLENYNILLFMGDNLSDFTSDFENKNSSERNSIVDEMYAEFGNKFIMLPNPMYGQWFDALIDFDYKNKEMRIDSLKRNTLLKL